MRKNICHIQSIKDITHTHLTDTSIFWELRWNGHIAVAPPHRLLSLIANVSIIYRITNTKCLIHLSIYNERINIEVHPSLVIYMKALININNEKMEKRLTCVGVAKCSWKKCCWLKIPHDLPHIILNVCSVLEYKCVAHIYL